MAARGAKAGAGKKASSTKKTAAHKLPKPPKTFEKFTRDYPDVASAYSDLGDAVHGSGPIDDHSRALIKLGISIGARLEGAVHSHARKALAAGATPEELRQVVLLALPTMGLPSMMAGLCWVNDILDKRPKRGR